MVTSRHSFIECVRNKPLWSLHFRESFFDFAEKILKAYIFHHVHLPITLTTFFIAFCLSHNKGGMFIKEGTNIDNLAMIMYSGLLKLHDNRKCKWIVVNSFQTLRWTNEQKQFCEPNNNNVFEAAWAPGKTTKLVTLQ